MNYTFPPRREVALQCLYIGALQCLYDNAFLQ